MAHIALPILSADAGLSSYLEDIKKFPMLSQEEEQSLAERFAATGDLSAAHTLVTSHLRLVAKIAMGYRGYGLPVSEMIAEGNIGLMQAVKRFDPEKGFRLSTYAMWWIKAAIQEYILSSWSLVKMGTTAAQKKLFFNLKKIKHRLGIANERSISKEQAATIAAQLEVSKEEVLEMDSRLEQADISLNTPVGYHGDTDSLTEHLDMLPSTDDSQETIVVEREHMAYKKRLFQEAFKNLNERERDIITKRRLIEPPHRLEDLSEEYSVSKERIRQIEEKAVLKLSEYVVKHGTLPASPKALLPAPQAGAAA